MSSLSERDRMLAACCSEETFLAVLRFYAKQGGPRGLVRDLPEVRQRKAARELLAAMAQADRYWDRVLARNIAKRRR